MKKYLLTSKGLSFVLVVAFLLALAFFTRGTYPGSNESLKEIHSIKIAGVNIKVDLATSIEEQTQGLSGRSGLLEDEGMLFVFKQSDRYAFWMKDMNFPIDIIWIGADLRVVYIKENALPSSYPETFSPTDDAKYVLEVMSGFSHKNNLKIGDQSELSY